MFGVIIWIIKAIIWFWVSVFVIALIGGLIFRILQFIIETFIWFSENPTEFWILVGGLILFLVWKISSSYFAIFVTLAVIYEIISRKESRH